MVWATPAPFVTAEVVTAAKLNIIKDDLIFLKSGVANLTSQTASVGPTVGTAELTLSTSSSITFDGTTMAEVSFSWYNVGATVATDTFFIRLYDGATQLSQWLLDVSANGGGGNTRAVLTPTAGAHTFTARLVRGGGTGTATLTAGATSPGQLLVRQVG